MQPAILTTISNLLYTFCITRLEIKYLFIVVVIYYCFSFICLSQNVLNSIRVSAKSRQCPKVPKGHIQAPETYAKC